MSDTRQMTTGGGGDAERADSGVTRLAQGFARRMVLLARGRGASEATCRYVWRAALAVSLATAEGHVCVPLEGMLDVQASGELFPGDAPALSVWRDALFASGLCAPASSVTAAGASVDGAADAANAWPLLLDDQDRLYLARYYAYEARLAAALARKLSHGAAGTSAALGDDDRARLQHYFGTGTLPGLDGGLEANWQMAAAALSLQRSLVVLSGGPGTGKTTTVVGLLACLLERDPQLRVALAAPTGKAAQRMQEALSARHDLSQAVRAALPEAALTLHRLLGVLPETAENVGRQFRHHAGNPLPYDLIVVDEASMIDLSMATQLLEAVPDGARLILLGDKDQLAAVEAGAVFGELSARRVFSPAMRGRLAQALAWPGDGVPASGPLSPQAPVDASGGLQDAVVWLERNYRFGEHSAIGRLATAIKTGRVGDARRELSPDISGALLGAGAAGRADAVARPQGDAGTGPVTAAPSAADDLLTWLPEASDEMAQATALAPSAGDATGDRVRLVEDGGVQLAAVQLQALAEGYAPYLSALTDAVGMIEQLGDPAAATPADIAMVAAPVFSAFGRFRVLCATRGGRRGVELLGAQLTAVLARQAGMAINAGGGAWFVGRPVLVTQNEYALGLFNGDIGIALPLGPAGALRVAFATPDGHYRLYSPASLPAHETAFTMTIHKSQGSEFERVAIVLPEQSSRVLSRELVYTGVTRARSQATLYAPWQVIASAIARPTQRDGGLTDRLMEALAAQGV